MSKEPLGSAMAASARLRTQLVIGAVVVLAVSILTLLFSFLGTITSAALLGMIFGTTRHSKWQLVAVGLIFPTVSFAFSQLLTFEKNVLLSGLCFAVFWVSYLLTRTGLYFEAKPAAPTNAPARRVAPAPVLEDLSPELNELQGSWIIEQVEVGKPRQLLEIRGECLSVRLCDAGHDSEVVLHGQLELKRLGAFKLGALHSVEGSDRVDCRFSSGSWLYRVVDEKLTVAWNFDARTSQEAPVVENYRRGAEAA